MKMYKLIAQTSLNFSFLLCQLRKGNVIYLRIFSSLSETNPMLSHYSYRCVLQRTDLSRCSFQQFPKKHNLCNRAYIQRQLHIIHTHTHTLSFHNRYR